MKKLWTGVDLQSKLVTLDLAMSPLDPDELQEGMQLLREALEQGKLHVAPHLADDFEQSLRNVRIDSSGRVDPTTVDSRIAMTARMLLWRRQREGAKEAAPLEEIQEAYFERVQSAFGEIEELRRASDASPYQVARALANQSEGLEENYHVVQAFVEEIQEFWANVSYPSWIQVEDDSALKAVFTGEIFPDGFRNAASLYGFYVDTIILPDPFLKVAPLFALWDQKQQVYEVTRLALQVLQYRELALTPLTPPIVMILPDRFGLEEGYRELITEAAKADAIAHASKLFGRPFVDADEVSEYVTRLATPEDVAKALKQPDLLLFDSDWNGTAEAQIHKWVKSEWVLPNIHSAGLHVWVHVVSRMGQATDSLRRSAEVGGVPVMHAPTSWQWLNWKMEYGSDPDPSSIDGNMHIVRALQRASEGEFRWLGDIPPAALIEMRAEGAIDEIRAILSNGVSELAQAEPNNFTSTSNHVIGNLRVAFADHQHALRELEKRKWKFAGRDLSGFLVAGGIEVAAAASGNPLFGLGAALVGLSGLSPNAREILDRLKEARQQREQLGRSPIGLLFNSKGSS